MEKLKEKPFFAKLPDNLQKILTQEIPSDVLQKKISKDFKEKQEESTVKIELNIVNPKTKLRAKQRNFTHFSSLANRSEPVLDDFAKSIKEKK
jgi:TRAP-type C4-dicarboxylate transport system substrate-binding protein